MKQKILAFIVFLSLINNSNAQQFFTPNETITQEKNNGYCYGDIVRLIPEESKIILNIAMQGGCDGCIDIIPEEYSTRLEKILICPAYRTNNSSQIKFDTTETKHLRQCHRQVIEIIPATFTMVTEQALSKLAYTETKRVTTNLETCLTDTNIACFEWKEIEHPTEYQTIRRQEVVTPRSTRSLELPTTYYSIKTFHPINDDPNGNIEVPAQYRIITKTVVHTPQYTRAREVPISYDTIIKKKIIKPATKSITPVRIVCEKDYSKYLPKVKKMLQSKGYKIDKINDEFSLDVKKAILKFQEKQEASFPMGQLDFETLKALGID